MKIIRVGQIDWRPFMKNLQNQPPPPKPIAIVFDKIMTFVFGKILRVPKYTMKLRKKQPGDR